MTSSKRIGNAASENTRAAQLQCVGHATLIDLAATPTVIHSCPRTLAQLRMGFCSSTSCRFTLTADVLPHLLLLMVTVLHGLIVCRFSPRWQSFRVCFAHRFPTLTTSPTLTLKPNGRCVGIGDALRFVLGRRRKLPLQPLSGFLRAEDGRQRTCSWILLSFFKAKFARALPKNV